MAGSVASKYLDGGYLEANPDWHDDDAEWKAKQVLGLLRHYHISPRSICDVGCGSGGVLEHLGVQLPLAELVGYEPAPQAAARAATRPRLRIFNEAIGDCRERFDVLLALDVIEHVEDYFSFMRSLHRLASYFMFHIPLDMSVQSVLRMTPLVRGRESVGHIHYFSREIALASLAETGYEVVGETFTRGCLELGRLGPKQKLAGIPRRAVFALRPNLAARVLGGFSLLVLARSANSTPDDLSREQSP